MANQGFISKSIPTQANHTYTVSVNVSLLGQGNATLSVFDDGYSTTAHSTHSATKVFK